MSKDAQGKIIFYDIDSGNVVISIDELRGFIVPTSPEDYIKKYSILSERNRDTFDYIELEYGEYAQDFAECNGYRVNPETKELEFSYPDPDDPEKEPEYQEPLSVQVETLGQDITDAKIEAMEQGQKQSDFDIRLLELEMR